MLNEVNAVTPTVASADHMKAFEVRCENGSLGGHGRTLDSRANDRNFFRCNGAVDLCSSCHLN